MLAFAVSCGESNKAEQAVAEKQQEVLHNNISTEEVQNSAVNDSVKKVYKNAGEKILTNNSLRSFKATLAPKELAAFLPMQILKAKRGNITEYQSGEGYSSASAIYDVNGGIYFEVRIFDNGPDAPLFDKAFFEELPQEANISTVPIVKSDAIGYMMINDYSKRNLANILYRNRIYVSIKTVGASNNELRMENILNSLNIQSILNKLN